ncbi:MAG: type II toxin-antitoxin system RelE/ParE family toxin [Kiloniellales bacterium]
MPHIALRRAPNREDQSAAMKWARISEIWYQVKKLLTPAERRATEDQIAADPLYWPVVPGTGGVRKARGGRASSGKRGGVRVIYYFRSRRETIYLLSIYAKSDRIDLTPADKKKLRTLVKSLEGT